MRRLNGLADVDRVFQSYDFGSDVVAGGFGLLKALLAAKASVTVSWAETRIPRLTPGTPDGALMRAMGFIRDVPETIPELTG